MPTFVGLNLSYRPYLFKGASTYQGLINWTWLNKGPVRLWKLETGELEFTKKGSKG